MGSRADNAGFTIPPVVVVAIGIVLLLAHAVALPRAEGSAKSITGGHEPPTRHSPELVLGTDHTERIGALALSPDAKLLASSSWDNTVKLWDVRRGTVLRTLLHVTTWPMVDNSLSFNRDGSLLVSGYPDGSIIFWNVNTGGVSQSFSNGKRRETSAQKTDDGATCVALSNNDTWLASGSDTGVVRLWNVSTRKETPLNSAHADSVTTLAFSPDGRWLASGSQSDGRIKVWEVATGRLLKELSHPSGQEVSDDSDDDEAENLSLTFRVEQGGSWLASASTQDDSTTVRLWGTEDWKNTATHSLRTELAGTVGFSGDGSTVAAVTGHGQVKLFELNPWRELAPLTIPFAPAQFYMPSAIAFSPDKHLLAVVPNLQFASLNSPFEDRPPDIPIDEGGIKVWDIPNRRLLRTLSAPTVKITNLSFSPDEQSLATGAQTSVIFWNLLTGEPRRINKPFSVISGFELSPDGRSLFTQELDGVGRVFRLWDINGNGEPRTIVNYKQGLGVGPQKNFSLSPGWTSLAAQKDLTTVGVVDVATGHPLPDIQIKDEDSFGGHALASPSFSPRGKWLAVVDSGEVPSGESRIAVLSTDTWKVAFTLEGAIAAQSPLTFSPDGDWIVGTSNAGTNLWKVGPGERPRLLAPDLPATSAAFSDDSKTLALGLFNNEIKLIDVATGRVLKTLSGHTQWPNSLSFSRDGKYLASGSYDGTTRIWETSTGDLLVTLILLGSDNWLAVTPDGLFDGTAEAMQQVSWRVEESNRIIPLDTFFNDFYYPGLLTEVMAGRRPKPERDLIAEMLVPGLKTMVAQGLAAVRSCDSSPVLCFKAAALPPPDAPVGSSPLSVDDSEAGSLDVNELEFNAGDQDCTYRKVLQNDALSDLGRTLCDKTPERFTTPWDNRPSVVSQSTLHILTVGIDRYDPNATGLQPLKYSVSGARALANFFVRQKEENASPFKDVRVWDGLFDRAATRKAIRSELSEIAGEVKEQDVVLLFFSGHGIVPRGQEMFYFAPVDVRTKTLQDARESGLTSAMMAEALRSMPARRVILIVDACQSGGVVDSLGRVAEAKANIALRLADTRKPGGQTPDAEGVGIYVIASSTPLQFAVQQASQLGNGPVVSVLLEALERQGSQPGEAVRVREVTDYVLHHLPQVSQQAELSFTPLVRTIGLDFSIATGGR